MRLMRVWRIGRKTEMIAVPSAFALLLLLLLLLLQLLVTLAAPD
jgi:hypothetical protein